jgi:non-ribosomal peptide synthetase component F
MTTLSGPERPDLLKDERLHDIFLLTATHYPNKVALRWQDEEITYRQLHQQALQMALALRDTKHIGPGSIVGIQLTHSAKLHVTIIAVLMTGATYAPFDAETPHERVSEVLADLQAVLLLVDSLTSVNHPLALDIQTLSGDKAIAADGNLSVDINANSAAYIICTSGSTGKPKAIAVSHRNICHLVRADNEIMQIRHEDIVYQGSSAAFDMFFEETFLAYLVGATLVIASASDVLSIDQLHLFFIRHSITVLFCVPTLLLLMKNDPALKLRLINTGGEACPQVDIVRRPALNRLLDRSRLLLGHFRL